MNEQTVLASAIQSRDAWAAIADHVTNEDLTEQGRVIYEAITTYYNADPSATACEPSLIAGAVGRTVDAEKHRTMFESIIDGLVSADVSPPNVVLDFIGHRRKIVAQLLATALLSGDEGAIGARLMEYGSYEGLQALDEEESSVLQGASLWDLLGDANDPANLIRVYPESLNNRLDGGLKRGHHVVIFARPEMGKTMTVINMIGGFLQDNRKVLYVGNEDPISDITMRVVNRLTGRTKYEVLEDLDGADMIARDRGYENLVMAALSPGTPREITALMEDHRPDVLVLDQLRNLNMHNDHFTQALEAAATQARNWAKRYNCVVVSVTQAGDSASNKSILDLGDVDSSNTGIPATADVMLGIGATDAHVQRGEIVFSLPKNKVSGRHEFFSVQTQPQLSKLTSLE